MVSIRNPRKAQPNADVEGSFQPSGREAQGLRRLLT